jgi:hypothetical protein
MNTDEQVSSLQEFSEVSRNCCKESPIFTSKWYTLINIFILINFRLVLFSFSFLSCTNAMLWNTFSPVARIAGTYFEVTSFAIDTFSFIYFAAYIIFVLPACWVIYRFPLNYSVIVGGGMEIIYYSYITIKEAL